MNQRVPPFTSDISAQRLVVINTAFLGDLILSIPFLNLLKKKYPNSSISLVCKKGIGDLFLKLKLVDFVFEVQKGSSRDYADAAKRLNEKGQDIVFCMHRSVRSYLFSLKLKTNLRVGYKSWYNIVGYEKKLERNLSLPEPLRIIQLLQLVDQSFSDFFNNETKSIDLNLKLSNDHLVEIPGWAKYPKLDLEYRQYDPAPDSGLRHIAIFPGSVWNTKRWTIESYAELTRRLIEMDFQVILMGGPGEESCGEFIQSRITSSRLTNMIGKSTVWESLLVLSQCELVVANDSASAHLAALLGKKILVFFGPTVLNFGYRPWGNSVYVMENSKLSCRPCSSHGPQECPIKTHECMKSISAESAFQKIESILI